MKPQRDSLTGCPCGAGRAYAVCCGRFLESPEGTYAPGSATELMRSRYTAFVKERADHLLATWHPQFRPASIDFDHAARWLGLEIVRSEAVDATHATVEFVARYRVAGRAVRLHEVSRFVHSDGRWLYTDGDQL